MQLAITGINMIVEQLSDHILAVNTISKKMAKTGKEI